MAVITNYGELRLALNDYMFHQRFLGRYDTALQNFEAAANRRLRTRKQEHAVELTTASQPEPAFIRGFCDVPADYLVWRTVQWRGRSPFVDLDYVHPAYLRSSWIDRATGQPRIFTIEGNTFFASPVDNTDAAYEFHYYRKIDSIVGAQEGVLADNWLIADYPDAYLFGVVAELAALARNFEMANLYKARRDEVFAEIIQLSALTTGATSQQVRTAEYF